MNLDSQTLFLYVLPLLLIVGFYLWWRHRAHRQSEQVLRRAREAGMTEPASLHPLIHVGRCLGCGACVKACPEADKQVLGLLHGKAALVNPAHCIGHGACARACPFDAIELVFGTEKRGVDIPFVDENFQTNVPGIYIAGELGGMGLIRNAVSQGVQAVAAIARQGRGDDGGEYDLVIVGAGPAGIAASLAAKEKGLRYITLEQESLGGTVAHYPRGKIVMTAPARLPIVGKMQFRETRKETLMAFWEKVVAQAGLDIHYRRNVERIEPAGSGFRVRAGADVYATRHVLLAIGRRGTPRKLGVPGEEQAKVVYRLIDPRQYQGQHVLVVGGGDSALEAAISIAAEPGSTVSLSYRSEAFTRAKEKNRKQIEALAQQGAVRLFMKSTVKAIDENEVVLNTEQGEQTLANDAVIVCAGGILPTGFLKSMGIEVETKYGTA